MKDIIIIGAGIAGMTAGIYGARAGKDVMIIEKLMCGGQIVNSPEVENYPGIESVSGYEFASKLYAQAEKLGVELVYETVSGIENHKDYKLVKCEEQKYKAKAVIIATGAKNRPLGLAREAELTGSGISYCTSCDGAFYKDKITAVVGAGNTAIDDAIYLSAICKKVYLIHRREVFRAEETKIETLRSRNNVEFVLNSRVTALNGSERLTSITVEDNEKNTREIDLDGLFVAIGQIPDSEAFASIVNVDASGYIIAGEECATNVKGIFAAGDCRTKKIRQLTTAAGDGAVAATLACEFIDGN